MNQHDDSIARTAQVLRLVHADLDISQTERIDRLVSAGDPLTVLREHGVVGSRPDFSAEIATISDWRAQGFGITDVLDEDYPALLSEVREAPGVIYWQGSLRPAEIGVCIVGSRNATSSVLDETYKLAGLLAMRNVPVISGLARGIDTAAHQGAVDAHGRTIAVMGTGLERTYPPANTQLRQPSLHQVRKSRNGISRCVTLSCRDMGQQPWSWLQAKSPERNTRPKPR